MAKMKCQHYLDENLPDELAELFIEAGHDALTVRGQRIGGATDEAIATICQNEGRAIVTMDMDFADIRTYPPRLYPGVLVFRLESQAREHLLRVATSLLPTLSEHALAGKLWIVEESRIRIRG